MGIFGAQLKPLQNTELGDSGRYSHSGGHFPFTDIRKLVFQSSYVAISNSLMWTAIAEEPIDLEFLI